MKGHERGLAPANRSEYEPRIESYRAQQNQRNTAEAST